ncbi:MAG: sodium/solute symporter [Sedimentisphaerales bacterium]|nr:sodium/solute symporter [Sedimentisphaerales bacterium]
MAFSWDLLVFIIFVVSVVCLGMLKSRHEKSDEDYFLAGRGLKWWLIGFSLIAANISTEQFVGMSGNAASHVGLAIASYEWMAAITLVVVAFCFLPYFLKAGIYTMPEFLEYRYNQWARLIMAVATLGIYMLLLGAVTYSGALTIKTLAAERGFSISLQIAALAIGVIAGAYVFAGGLKACAWADLIQGSALIIGGAIIMFYAFDKLGGATEAAHVVDVKTGAVAVKTLSQDSGAIQRFWELNKVRMNMFLPKDDSILPWTALLLGLWIPNFYYWGLNQYITQRTLGSASLAQGQKGIVFSAFMKLLIPFVIVIPGIIAFNLFYDDMKMEAVTDNAPIIAKYALANPDTKLVEVVQSPTEQEIASWPSGKFMIAVFAGDGEKNAVKERNPFVLPITRNKYQELSVFKYTKFICDDKSWKSAFPQLAAQQETYNTTKFISDDKSWKSTFPQFAAELETYNTATEQAAKAAGVKVVEEKFIAYKYDTALAQLLGKVLPQGVGLFGFVLAALLGAVVSSLAAMLNAASTIFTMDVYKKYVSPQADQKNIVTLGRICVIIFTLVAIGLAPMLGNPKISNSIFTIIQEGQGFISPGILAVFAFGLLSRKAPRICGVVGLVTNIIAYGVLKWTFPDLQFLNRMAICFGLCLLVMIVITILKPLPQPVEFKHNTRIELHSCKPAMAAGVIVIAVTLLLYFLFSPLGLL